MTNIGCSVSPTQVWLQRFWSSFQALQIDCPEDYFDDDDNNDDDADDADDDDTC